jgi:hypothetical protein
VRRRSWRKDELSATKRNRALRTIALLTAVLGLVGCAKDAAPGGDTPATNPVPTKPQPDAPKTEVPAELVGAWEHGPIDFALWENYKQGHYAGRNSVPSREAMVIRKDGTAKFYRYQFALGLYEELIDCEGTITFPGDGTFTFTPTKGRKRFLETDRTRNRDRPLTDEELKSPKLAGKRQYAVVPASDPPAVRITVPTSAPYNWYKKP